MAIPEINDLKKLSNNKQLAFSYLTCERLYPNYVYFSENNNFGHPEVLRQSINYIYDNLFIDNADKLKVSLLINSIEKIIPEPAEFDTVLASSALDTCTVIIETLYFLIDKQESRIEDISTAALDTPDMYIQEIENLDYNNDSLFQKKIDSHPLMIKEISIQKGIIEFLRRQERIDFADIQTLIMLQENNNKGSLNL